MTATAKAKVASWDENPYAESPNTAKTSRAKIGFEYHGDIEGEGLAELLMAYTGSEAEYVGLERVTGTIGGRSGTFVVSVAVSPIGATELPFPVSPSRWTTACPEPQAASRTSASAPTPTGSEPRPADSRYQSASSAGEIASAAASKKP